MTAVSAAKPTPWRDQLFITLTVLLAAWIGAVHVLAAGLVFVAGQNAQGFAHLQAVAEAAGAAQAGSGANIGLVLAVIGIVLWMPLPWLRARAGSKGKKPARSLRIVFYGAELALMLWLLGLALAAGFLIDILGRDAQTQQQLIAAFAPGSDGSHVLAAAAWVAAPSLVLWLLASWGQAGLRAQAQREAAQAASAAPETSLAAAKDKE
jgi:hypothetical protein